MPLVKLWPYFHSSGVHLPSLLYLIHGQKNCTKPTLISLFLFKSPPNHLSFTSFNSVAWHPNPHALASLSCPLTYIYSSQIGLLILLGASIPLFTFPPLKSPFNLWVWKIQVQICLPAWSFPWLLFWRWCLTSLNSHSIFYLTTLRTNYLAYGNVGSF